MNAPFNNSKQHGFTLVELVIAITIIGIIMGGMSSMFMSIARSSATPAIERQAISIAEAYMDEIMSLPFADPDTEVGIGNNGEARGSFDDVNDYVIVNDTAGALDMTGTSIVGLETYNVDVDVTDDGGTFTLGVDQAYLITITVTHDNSPTRIVLSGHRMNYD